MISFLPEIENNNPYYSLEQTREIVKEIGSLKERLNIFPKESLKQYKYGLHYITDLERFEKDLAGINETNIDNAEIQFSILNAAYETVFIKLEIDLINQSKWYLDTPRDLLERNLQEIIELDNQISILGELFTERIQNTIEEA